MPITPFLAYQAFEPEVVETMSAAFVATCDALGLEIGDDDDPRLDLSPRRSSNSRSAASVTRMCFAK